MLFSVAWLLPSWSGGFIFFSLGYLDRSWLRSSFPPLLYVRPNSGTAYYLAKEVFDGNGYGKPVDLWAVGIVLFVILSGRFCFFGDTDERFMRRLRAGVRFPESEWGTISEGARSLIRGLLRPDPATRLTASQALRHPWLQPARDRTGDPVPHMPLMGTAAGGDGGGGGGRGGGGDGSHHCGACEGCRLDDGGDRRSGLSGGGGVAPLPPIKPNAFSIGGRPPRRAGGSIGGGGLSLSVAASEKRAAAASALTCVHAGGNGRYGASGGGAGGGRGGSGGGVSPLPPMPEESMSLRLGQYMPPSLDAERTIAGFAVNVPPAKWRGAGGAVRTD